MLHGNGSSHSSFDAAVDVLKDHFTIYALDSRGQGANPKEKELHYPWIPATHNEDGGLKPSFS